jgi:hypothetical protein
MSRRVFTRLLILIYSLAIAGVGLLEAGHEIAHTIRNNFHHHEASHHHKMKDHGMVLHDDTTSADSTVIFSLSCSFIFYEFYTMVLTDSFDDSPYFLFDDVKSNMFFYSPFTPPPMI